MFMKTEDYYIASPLSNPATQKFAYISILISSWIHLDLYTISLVLRLRFDEV